MKLAIPPRAAIPTLVAAPSPVRAAFEAAMAFAPSHTALLYLPAQRLQELAQEEASFGEIAVNERGLTAGTRLHVLQPGRALLARWREARGAFDAAIEPKMADIRAIERLATEIGPAPPAPGRRGSAGGTDLGSPAAEPDHPRALAGGRGCLSPGCVSPMASATRPCGLTVRPTGSRCCASGSRNGSSITTRSSCSSACRPSQRGPRLLLGVVLAFAAHGHGELLKQWSFRFGHHQGRMSWVAGYRLLGLSTLGLLIVLAAAGGSRYAAAAHALAGQPAENILGSQVVVEVNPVRDVLISLLANLGAWVVGVFLAYFSHDPDPEFMDATRQHRKASRAFFRARRSVDEQVKAFEGSFEKDVSGMQRAAAARTSEVAAERAMLEQVNKRGEGVAEAIASAVRANAERYRDVLSQVAVARRWEVSFVRRVGDKAVPLTPYDYKAADLLVDADLLRAAGPGPAWDKSDAGAHCRPDPRLPSALRCHFGPRTLNCLAGPGSIQATATNRARARRSCMWTT